MTVAEVARVLAPDNQAEVLPRFFGLSKREAQALAAELAPRECPPQRTVVTPLGLAPTAAPATPVRSEPAATGDATCAAVQPVEPAMPAFTSPEEVRRAGTAAPVVAPRPKTEPLTAELNRLHVTVSRRLLEKLEAARAALSHSRPGASDDEILETALDALLDRHAKRKGIVKKPLAQPRPAEPDHVPAHVRRAVWERDGGKCQWKLASGEICGSTHRVEIDHRLAKARGGSPTVANLRCLCRSHNLEAARATFGDEWMDRYARKPGARGPEAGGEQRSPRDEDGPGVPP